MNPAKAVIGNSVPSLWDVLRKGRRNILELIPHSATEEPLVSGKTAGVRWHMVMAPAILHHITDTNYTNYPRSNLIRSVLRPAIGNGLFLAQGEPWLWQRRAAAPSLGKRYLNQFKPRISEIAEQMSQRLANAASQDINVYDEAIGATFNLICHVLFSDVDAIDQHDMETAFADYVAGAVGHSMLQAAGLPNWVTHILPGGNTPKTMHDMLESIIAQRKAKGPQQNPDMLDQLLTARHPKTSAPMDTIAIRDNLLTFMIAGHDTTALTLSWALYLCAFDTAVQDKLRDEASNDLDLLSARSTISSATSTGQTAPSDLPFSEQVISETLRLYPPAAISSRTALASDTIGELEVKQGDLILMPTYALHRHKKYWEDPDSFRPQRFAKGSKFDQLIYMPFGHGPRSCIGSQLAFAELKILLSTLVSRFEFSLIPDNSPEPVVKLTLFPKKGILLNVKPIDS